jgi:hypothetical protein
LSFSLLTACHIFDRIIFAFEISRGGGIGRRSRLKIYRSRGRGGSSPFRGTKKLIALKVAFQADLRAFCFACMPLY